MFYWAYKKELLQLCPWLCLTSRSHYNKWSSLGTIKALPKEMVEILYGPFFKQCVQFMNKFFFNVTPLNGAVDIYNLQRASQIPCIWHMSNIEISRGTLFFVFRQEQKCNFWNDCSVSLQVVCCSSTIFPTTCQTMLLLCITVSTFSFFSINLSCI